MNELLIGCLEADALTALQRGEITTTQYDNRMANLKKMREDIKE